MVVIFAGIVTVALGVLCAMLDTMMWLQERTFSSIASRIIINTLCIIVLAILASAIIHIVGYSVHMTYLIVVGTMIPDFMRVFNLTT